MPVVKLNVAALRRDRSLVRGFVPDFVRNIYGDRVE
jgi:hypothetical protein